MPVPTSSAMGCRSMVMFHTFLSRMRKRPSTYMSSATCLSTLGRWTLSAMSSPAHVRALYTCPRLALAMCSALNDANRGLPGLSLCSGQSGDSGPSWPRSLTMICQASSSGKGWLLDWSDLSAREASSPMRSARCAIVWPHLTKTGPSCEMAARRTAPRVRCSAGSSSSASHTLRTLSASCVISSSRSATSHGRSLKKRCSLAESYSPASSEYTPW
mmetsp:Transcript_5892/g.15386  ORF Transcript_5892/g.15386 Transcript_5892/m.15386 type:complete len:216 (+) Transcript_5892:746-1393(+)